MVIKLSIHGLDLVDMCLFIEGFDIDIKKKFLNTQHFYNKIYQNYR